MKFYLKMERIEYQIQELFRDNSDRTVYREAKLFHKICINLVFLLSYNLNTHDVTIKRSHSMKKIQILNNS
jgi:hypothetical protein